MSSRVISPERTMSDSTDKVGASDFGVLKRYPLSPSFPLPIPKSCGRLPTKVMSLVVVEVVAVEVEISQIVALVVEVLEIIVLFILMVLVVKIGVETQVEWIVVVTLVIIGAVVVILNMFVLVVLETVAV